MCDSVLEGDAVRERWWKSRKEEVKAPWVISDLESRWEERPARGLASGREVLGRSVG